MAHTEDSKAHWLSIRRALDQFDITLGRATAQGYVNDPRMLAFIASRYKFVSKMLAHADVAIEIGCGDAFGGPIVAQTVKRVICTDIDEETLAQNRERCKVFKNMEFHYHDFRASAYPEKARAIYLVDVIEHIFQKEEPIFLRSIVGSLTADGFVLMGTPNKHAAQYASQHSREGHVNLKSQETLRDLLLRYFQNVFMFSMNDEVVHTGFDPMAHYIWGLGVGPR
jgi:cyclopropane fatty-acyl-phospholipid synthase-like methyltransferase